MNERTANWLAEANWDLENAKILFENDRFNTVVFHCQQAAEKAVKALLYHNKLNGWGHSIHALLEKYKEIKNENFDDIERTALSLDKHYIITRYPDALPNIAPHKAYNKQEAELAIIQATNIINFVNKEIKGNQGNDRG
ncbi:MAG: HEPN domain-containing protein [Candidatus Lokiarchaeota archaeon]|nr:HEPN domain-containing protein [Candidatus Lokiarchaeota archaeon]